MLLTLAVAALVAVQAYLLFNAAFLYYPMLGALLARWAPKAEPGAPTRSVGRLAVLIAAHNEQAVIGPTIEGLARQSYPQDAFDVFVVADNCSDQTAEVARRAGATVFERSSSGPSTKGQALHHLWDHVGGSAYGGVVLLDADNQTDPNFLAAIANSLAHGHVAVQGLRRGKGIKGIKPTDTARLDALTEVCTHRIGAAGRVRLGLNGPLMGSGLAYDASLFDRLIRHNARTVVEDCEWQAQLALENVGIHWTDAAMIFDEKTARPDALQTQRTRWMTGRGEVSRLYVGPLLKAFFTTGNLNALDMAAFLLTVPRVLALAGWLGFFCLALVAPGLPGLFAAPVWFACLALFGAYVCLGLYLDDAPASAYAVLFRGVLILPRFGLQMARATWKAVTGVRVNWVATPKGS